MESPIKLTKLAQCAGCGAKVGAGVLSKLLAGLPVHQDPNLLVGFAKSDDASIYRLTPELALVQTLDFFPPIADDPYLFGQIAAANALSDVYAMGGQPKLAMNILCITAAMSKASVQAILQGGYEKVYEAGAILTGGHSIEDQEPKYGLSVTGLVHPQKFLTNSGALPGDLLILTKPLGLGILSTAAKADLLSPALEKQRLTLMATLNKTARDIMVHYPLHACTDITGFGLLGHLLELAQGSGVSLDLDSGALPILPQALELAAMGILPAGMYRNRDFAAASVQFAGSISQALQDLLFDPQTSGGLLMAVAPDQANALLGQLQDQLAYPRLVGQITAPREYRIYVQ
ncbi:MAG: selenide, water dikinase SelD [Clostridiales bacterium]